MRGLLLFTLALFSAKLSLAFSCQQIVLEQNGCCCGGVVETSESLLRFELKSGRRISGLLAHMAEEHFCSRISIFPGKTINETNVVEVFKQFEAFPRREIWVYLDEETEIKSVMSLVEATQNAVVLSVKFFAGGKFICGCK